MTTIAAPAPSDKIAAAAAAVIADETYGSGYVAWPKELAAYEFPDGRGGHRRLNPMEERAMRDLLGRLQKGQYELWVADKRDPRERVKGDRLGIKQDTLALAWQRHVRTVGRLLKTLEEHARLICRREVREKDGSVQGTIIDLSPALIMLPKESLVKWGLWGRLRRKMSGRVGPDDGAQETLDIPPSDLRLPPEPSQNGAESPSKARPDAAEGDPPYRTSVSATSDSSNHAMRDEQHTPGSQNGTPRPDPDTDTGVVALLKARGVKEAVAMFCVRTKGRDVCLEWLRALPWAKINRNRGGYLASAILQNYSLPSGYLLEKERRAKAAASAARIAKAIKDSPTAPVVPSAEDVRDASLAVLAGDAALVAATQKRLAGRYTPFNRHIQEYRAGDGLLHFTEAQQKLLLAELSKTLQEQRTAGSARERDEKGGRDGTQRG